jgi:AAA15 family ATPase/GTPase
MLNSVKLEPIVNWITNHLVIFTVKTYLSNVFNFFTVNFCKDVDNKQKILKFLQAADLNIVDFELEGQLNFLHKINETNDLTQFPLEYESEGTKRLFIFAGPLMDILEKGRILMIDELDNSLHPSIVRFMLELIHNPQLNRHNAQIIFTTHDSSILDNNLLRRDQVWFVEKDKQQSTQLYPLTDFKPRPNESLQKGYIEGRYGALPFIGDLEDF